MRNSKGDLPLHEAVASGRRELVKWLLDGRPSQVNATNHEGRTPLHIAAATDNADLCRLLLDRGAEVNLVARSSRNEPMTPLDCATTRGHRSTAKYLQMHGGLPASKLSNMEIVIDGAPIIGLPTRRVTSTKIDVHDRIRIEKKEIVELPSPVPERRRLKYRDDSDSSNESSSYSEKVSRRRNETKKHADKHKERRKRLMHTQKSFSDGYDSELDGYERENSRDKKHSRKNRSKSEPSRRYKTSPKHRRRYKSRSDSSSHSETYSDRKKNRRHHKRTKRKSTSPSETSSSESSERRNTKRKGKKTSIHIENDDEKQSVNIIKYKNTDSQVSERNDGKISEVEVKNEIIKSEPDKEEIKPIKCAGQSETETDTLSVKTNMIITEAQIHMERQSSQLGNSELNVSVDSSNNVSIETSNLSVTHKDLTQESKSADESINQPNESKDSTLKEDDTSISKGDEPFIFKNDVTKEMSGEESITQNKIENEENSNKNTELPQQTKTQNHEIQGNEVQVVQSTDTKAEVDISRNDTKEYEEGRTDGAEGTTENINGEKKVTPISNLALVRRKSFQILSGPDDTSVSKEVSVESKTSLDIPSIEQTEPQEKSSLPAVSFSNKDEIFVSKECKADHYMGESVDHSLDPETDKQVQDSILQKDSSDSNAMSTEEHRKDYTTATGSSTENTQSQDKGLVEVFDDSMDTSDRAVQKVILENISGDYDVNLILPQTPKKVRKISKEGQGSSRKSSIYETESYKVLSDVASAPDVMGILKKTSNKIDDGSLEDDREFIREKVSKDDTYIGRVPSISDNELYSHSEADGRRKRFRKKGRTKSRTTVRSKSENSERGYESSGLMDSGFEPSPRAQQRCIASPRLAAYYQQRNASGRYSGKSDSRIPVRKPGDKYAVDMKSVTQKIQTNMRRYVDTKII